MARASITSDRKTTPATRLVMFYGLFSFLWNRRKMDLSFSRRQHGKKTGLPGSHELASLLAEISVRQSVSPTAKAQMHTEKPRFSAASDHPEIAPFAPNDAKEAAAIEIASFNPEVADVMITQSKSS